jgi:hypothetical protein
MPGEVWQRGEIEVGQALGDALRGGSLDRDHPGAIGNVGDGDAEVAMGGGMAQEPGHVLVAIGRVDHDHVAVTGRIAVNDDVVNNTALLVRQQRVVGLSGSRYETSLDVTYWRNGSASDPETSTVPCDRGRTDRPGFGPPSAR